jgi:hypothetical protein
VCERVAAKLAKERCWRCIVTEAWEDLAPYEASAAFWTGMEAASQ